MKNGRIIDIDTLEDIGEHQGVFYYTIGQRKGFGVGGNRGPYYCCGKNVEHNLLYLTSIKNEHYLDTDKAYIKDINWIRKPAVKELTIGCKFRYRQSDQTVKLTVISENEAILTYPQKIKAVTPGQQAVFYLDDEMLGGGVIEKTYLNDVDMADYLNERVLNGIGKD